MVVLVTGSSRGIGDGIKTIFKEHTVINPSRIEMDLGNTTSVERYLEGLPPVDIIINNAGVNYINTLERETLQNIQNTFAVNYLAPLTICQHFLSHMKNQKYGRIVNIGSIWINHAKPGRGSYSASKNALHSLTRTITSEYSEHNILCNTISPGYIVTDLTLQNNSEEDIQKIKEQIPQRRLGTVEEVAKLVYFLTLENTYLNGQNITIDGGYSATAKS